MPSHRAIEEGIATAWGAPEETLVCLSVRSGFDLYLQAMAWPPGSEVLVSAITIPDMPHLLRCHDLTPIPVDVDADTLFVRREDIAAQMTPKTRAILVAHLFGSRQPIGELIDWAHERQIAVIEDCAQAYDGEFRGNNMSDVRMFSFGPIKTATALGGAVLQVADQQICGRMRALQNEYPLQGRMEFARRVFFMVGLKLLAQPVMFTAFVHCCSVTGIDYEVLLTKLSRGFSGRDLLSQIRRAPCFPLLQMIERRLRQDISGRIGQRKALARKLFVGLNEQQRIGMAIADHSHWVVPIQSRDPEGLIRRLREHGFDATRRASSLTAVSPPAHRLELTPGGAEKILSSLLFLPVHPRITNAELLELRRLILEFETGVAQAAAPFAVAGRFSGQHERR